MDRIIIGALSACLFSLAFLLWAGPPEGRIGIDRPAARMAMATQVRDQVQQGIGRISVAFVDIAAVPRRTTVLRPEAEVAALCDGIMRDAAAVGQVRARGLYSYDQMLMDAGDDPVLSWLVTLAWAVVPEAGDAPAMERYQAIVARDCATAFT